VDWEPPFGLPSANGWRGRTRKFRILFLCPGNSTRSILAEYFLKRMAPTHFEVYSAGANPKGTVHPYVLELLRDGYHIDASGARSKSWDEFRHERFDFVITVRDKVREPCPNWPGQPIIAHWGSVDPESVTEADLQRRLIKRVGVEIFRRLGLFTSLPMESLDRMCTDSATAGARGPSIIGNSRLDA